MNAIIRLLRLVLWHRLPVAILVVTSLAITLLSMTVPYVLGRALDLIIIHNPESGEFLLADPSLWTLFAHGGIIVAVALVRGGLTGVNIYASEVLSQKIAYFYRRALYAKSQEVDFVSLRMVNTGQLMSRVTSDVEILRLFVRRTMPRISLVTIRGLGIPVILVITNWELTLVLMAFTPVVFLQLYIARITLSGAWDEVQGAMDRSLLVQQENYAGHDVVSSFGAEEHEMRKYEAAAADLRDRHISWDQKRGKNLALMVFYTALCSGAVLWYGGLEILRGDLTIGEMVMFMFFAAQMSLPVREGARIITNAYRTYVSGKRVYAILDTEPPVVEREGAKALSGADVAFENVSFSYAGEGAVKDVTFALERGQMLAITGPPGAGKSTLASLLHRYRDVDEGRITVGGVDIKDATLHSLRRKVGLVHQGAFLFSATIGENISYGKKDASEEEVRKASAMARIGSWIDTLPLGYGTPVGVGGSAVSGGQRQRLCIARTLLTDPDVLVLDDSTSSIDAETEQEIRKTIASLKKTKAIIVITHRQAMALDADVLITMDQGRITSVKHLSKNKAVHA